MRQSLTAAVDASSTTGNGNRTSPAWEFYSIGLINFEIKINITIYIRFVGKMMDQHFNAFLSSNPGDKIQKRLKTMVQICPLLLTRIRTLSPGLEDNITFTLKYGSRIFPTTLIYMVMLENCWNNILMYICSPIQETIYFCL